MTFQKPIFERPPTRVAEQTSPGQWVTRPWRRDELVAYIKEVLGRSPTAADYTACFVEK